MTDTMTKPKELDVPITSASDVSNAEEKVVELSDKFTQLINGLQDGTVDDQAVAVDEAGRIQADLQEAIADYRNKKAENKYDNAVVKAVETSGEGTLIEDNWRKAVVLANAVKSAITGGTGIRLVPNKEVDSDDTIRCINPEPTMAKEGKADIACFQSTMIGPDEVVRVLASPPPTRSNPGMVTATLDSGFTNSPNLTGFYREALWHELFAGTPMDDTLTHTIDVPGLEPVNIASYSQYPTAALVAESGTFAESDVSFNKQVLRQYKYGFGMVISNEWPKQVHINSSIASIQKQMMLAIQNACANVLTVGDGDDKPHGFYQAALEAFQSANSRTYRGDANGNFGNDNRNKVSVDGDSNVASNTNIARLSAAYSKLSTLFHRSAKTAFVASRPYAFTLLSRQSQDFTTNMLYNPVDFRGADPQRGVMYHHLGTPVIDNPWLAQDDGTADNKLFVFGDFDGYWVRRSDFQLWASDHVKAEKDSMYLRAKIHIDGMVPHWSWDANRQGPFIYGVAT